MRTAPLSKTKVQKLKDFLNNKQTRKIILRRKNENTEGDKYQYFVSCNHVEMTTPFKDKATVLIEGQEVKVISKDWKVINIKRHTNPELYNKL